MWWLYQLGLCALVLLALPVVLWRRGRQFRHGLQRLGPYDGSPPAEVDRPLWIHAVSVGEVGVAAALAAGLPPGLPLLVTTITATGHAQARTAFAGRAEVAYLPFDLGVPVRKFFRRFDPRALILVEGDHWPLLLREARRRDLGIAVVNGRVSDRSFPRLLRVRRLLTPLYGPIRSFGMQSAESRDRLIALGVDPARIEVTGNLKYEAKAPAPQPALLARLRAIAGARPIVVAGSTMAGEEPPVIAAFRECGGGRRALLVVAPRHPARFDAVHALLQQAGLGVARRSAFGDSPAAGGAPSPAPDAILLDSVGDLAAVYELAAAAFVGGSLVPTGGHNPLEPARARTPVAVGPSMENFRDMAEQFDRAGAWRRVRGAADLAAAWREWLNEPEAARAQVLRADALLAANRGALARTLALLAPILAAFPARVPAADL